MVFILFSIKAVYWLIVEMVFYYSFSIMFVLIHIRGPRLIHESQPSRGPIKSRRYSLLWLCRPYTIVDVVLDMAGGAINSSRPLTL